MRQGRVYFPPITLPPGQETDHRIVVLSNNQVINRSANNQFLVCAIIRSAINQSGRPVGRVPGHTIPVSQIDFVGTGVISHDSLIETHQLFHVSKQDLSGPSVRYLGDLNTDKLREVLDGAKKLLS